MCLVASTNLEREGGEGKRKMNFIHARLAPYMWMGCMILGGIKFHDLLATLALDVVHVGSPRRQKK